MKKVLSFLLPLFVLSLMLMSSRCKQECEDISNPDCPNYDPCYGKTGTIADFKIMEVGESRISIYTFAYETDTVNGWDVIFEPRNPIAGAEYRWEIGVGVYEKQKVTLNFQSVSNGSVIPIKLIVKRKDVDKTCFPNDKGIDSLTKNMYINYKCLVAGLDTTIYRGHHKDNPNEELEVKFYYRNLLLDDDYIVENLVKEFKKTRLGVHFGSYRMLDFNGYDGMSIQGTAYLNRNDSISIKYEYNYPTGPSSFSNVIKREFIGKKIR